MTTRNIDGIQPAREAAATVAESARLRQQALAEQAAARVAARAADNENFEVARRASEQEHNDHLVEIGEEVEQLNFVLGVQPESDESDAEAPAPAAEVDAPDEPAEPAAEAPAPVAVVDAPTEQQQAIGLPAAQTVVINNNPIDPRGWNWRRWWWLMLLGALLGFIFAAWLWDWFAQSWLNSPGPTVGAILSTLHWVFWTLAGFFTGGYISYRLEERRDAPPAA